MMRIQKLTALLLALALTLSLCAPALAEALPAETVDAAEEILASAESEDGDSGLESEVILDDFTDSEIVPGDMELIPEADVEATFEEDVSVEDGVADDSEADPLAEAAGVEAEGESPLDEAEDDFVASSDMPFDLTERGSVSDNTDPDALFAGYVDRQLGAPGIAENRQIGLTSLSGVNLKLYKKLASFAKSVASGSRTSTKLTLTPSNIGCSKVTFTYRAGMNVSSAMGLKLSKIFNTLLTDYPYELFWFDKTRGWSLSYTYLYNVSTGKITVKKLTFSFRVAEAYASGSYKVNASKLSLVSTAKQTIDNIVRQNASKSDIEKLRAYANTICQLTDYNTPAAEYDYPYGDPWQLIYVFDGNLNTKVVCEGFAKAFKYLCDLSTFRGNVYCYLAEGNVYFSTGGGGAHMWNIVSMPDGNNYLVDVTHSDNGSYGMNASDNMFLRHASYVNSAGYSYDVYRSGGTGYSTYVYDDVCTSALPAKLRTLSTTPHNSSYDTSLNVQGLTLTAPKTKLVVSDKVTITPAYNPYNAKPVELYWSSSNKKVATVSSKGVVTAKAPGTVKISVRTWNEKTASITLTVRKAVQPTKIALNYTGTQSLNIENTLKLQVTFSPWNGRSRLTWTSSNKRVATVSKSGLVTPVGEGVTTITVKTANGKKARVKISVYDLHSPDGVNIYSGSNQLTGSGWWVIAGAQPIQLTARAYRNDGTTATQRITWKSSNKAVATVSSSGKLTFKKYGTVTITATASGKVHSDFTMKVRRNRAVFMTKAPTRTQIKSVKTWTLKLKSVEIVNSNKAVASFYLINRLGRYTNYLQNLRATLNIKSGDTESAFLSRKLSKVNVRCYKDSYKLFKVTYTGSQIKNLYNLTTGVTVNMDASGTLYYTR